MTWHAKRKGAYTTSSSEYEDNVWEIYNTLSDDTQLMGDAWTYEAIVGLIANASWESGLNPWRYNSIGAYGLVQFYPNTYYIGNRGVAYSGYAPSLNPDLPEGDYSDGANASDGKAQLLVIDSPTDTKYIVTEAKKQKARDLSWSILEWDSIQAYKMCDDIDEAIQSFLLFYEYPTTDLDELRTEFNNRKSYVARIEEILGGQPPVPPVPPSEYKGMPLYFYITKRFKRRKGLI